MAQRWVHCLRELLAEGALDSWAGGSTARPHLQSAMMPTTRVRQAPGWEIGEGRQPSMASHGIQHQDGICCSTSPLATGLRSAAWLDLSTREKRGQAPTALVCGSESGAMATVVTQRASRPTRLTIRITATPPSWNLHSHGHRK